MSTATDLPSTRTNPARLLRGGLLVAAAAAALNLTVWTAARAAGIDLAIPSRAGGTMALTVLPVIAFTAVPLVLGSLVLGLLAGRVARPLRVWTILAVSVGVVSLAPVPAIGAGAANAAVLVLLHLVATSAAVVALPRAIGLPHTTDERT